MSLMRSKKLHAHFDCFSGAAGDMMMASCIDAASCLLKDSSYKSYTSDLSFSSTDELLNLIQDNLKNGIPEIKDEFGLIMKRVWRGGMGSIAATKVDVTSIYEHKAAPVPQKDDGDDIQNTSFEVHDHSHEHGHSHSHGNTHSGPLRNLPQIRKMLEESSPEHIPPIVAKLAIETFTKLAIAESFTHGSTNENTVHFHEVGAIDSIVDIIGTLLCLYHLNVDLEGEISVSSSPLPMGEGTVWTDHGQLPVPAFATMRLMMGMKTCPGPGANSQTITGELVTPTAAALLRVLTGIDESSHGGRMGRAPNMIPRAIGLGAGTKDFIKFPNVVRLILGSHVGLDQHECFVKKETEGEELSSKLDGHHSHSHDHHRNIGISKEDTSAEEPSIHHSHVHEHMHEHSHVHSVNDDKSNQEISTKDQSSHHNHQHSHDHSHIHTHKKSEEDGEWNVDKLTLLQANLDDITSEHLAFAMDLLIESGAVDAWVGHIVMKKNRSAHQLNCLYHSNKGESMDEKMLDIIFRHTTTLGIRIQRDVERISLKRSMLSVKTEYGDINVKVGTLGSENVSLKAEFEDCKKISIETGIPIKAISDLAVQLAKQKI
ncbi:hypothetical protein CTEN210_15356 [Chaetoceros tenuissimus]|uniref:Nickel insertion protein n=1 Tax=Chaetoceros tenuissimus TaxID=426638 RepID=A0AAD3HCT6_9STRA|nr:hypothetical protein CTEN210_15356 [Chaetoceros tenuissimus]